MKINKCLLTVNEFSRPNIKLSSVKGIVIHYVSNTNSTAKNNRDYFNNLATTKLRHASAHFIIDNKEIIQCLEENEMAYHVGGVYTELSKRKLGKYPNDCTIGIECCHIDSNGKMTENTIKQLKELVIYLMSKYNLTINDLYLHKDITGKNCHRWFVENPKEWEKFKVSLNNPIDTELIEAVQALNKVGVINTIDAWSDKTKFKSQYYDSLINNFLLYIEQSTGCGMDCRIVLLYRLGLISSLVDWLTCISHDMMRSLIIKMWNYIKHKKSL